MDAVDGPGIARRRQADFAAVLPPVVQSVGAARRMLREDLVAQGVAAPVLDDAMAVLSELVANSLRHATPTGDGGVRVSWRVSLDRLDIQVTDGGGPRRPVETRAAPTDTGGRGLSIVRQLTSTWGVSEEDDSITVHAVLPVRPSR